MAKGQFDVFQVKFGDPVFSDEDEGWALREFDLVPVCCGGTLASRVQYEM